jgi:1,2-diacylglycerol 3-alpha-glucosyltransferase
MKSLYRIAMVAPGPFPGPRGSQVLVRGLAESLVALGHTVHVVAYGGGEETEEIPGLHIHRTPAFLGGASSYGPHPWRVVLNLFLLARLYQVVRRHRVDLIHAHNYEAPALSYFVRFLLGIPVVYHAHNLMGDELAYYFESPLARWLARLLGEQLDRSVPRRADRVVALSNAMADELRANGVAAERIEVIPPGVFPPEGDEGPAEDPYPGVKLIAYAGNLDPYQDVLTLIRAMGLLAGAEAKLMLVLITHTACREVEGQIRALGLEEHVRVVVADGFAAVRTLLRRADVLVCPRASWSGFPIKLLNYMAAGRPMVLCAGAARALEDGPWVVVPSGDPSALAQAVLATLEDPALQGKLGSAALALIQGVYDWKRVAPQVEGLYGRALGSQAEAA